MCKACELKQRILSPREQIFYPQPLTLEAPNYVKLNAHQEALARRVQMVRRMEPIVDGQMSAPPRGKLPRGRGEGGDLVEPAWAWGVRRMGGR